MKTLILAAILVSLSTTGFSQKGKSTPQNAVTARVTTPAEIDSYKQRASYATEVVITKVDELKAFQRSPAFNDLFTSPAVQQAYEDQITTFANTLQMVQEELLSTATGILIGAQNQLNAARQMHKYRESAY